MTTKLQLITAMYEHSIAHVTDSRDAWQDFLHSASRNYKLPFDEQILIHTQRPEATAVASIETWNTRFGRWVNRGATGIAVVDRAYLGKRRLKYYFDIADTHGSAHSRPVPLWEMKPEYEADVIETLEATFGELTEKDTLAQAIVSAASNAVTDNLPDYLTDLLHYREDSFLEELDDLNVEVLYCNVLKSSVAYMLLSRCGVDPATMLENDDFKDLWNFNTLDTVTMLGTATSAIAETGLREIASTVLNLQKSERAQIRTFAEPTEMRDNIPEAKRERSFEHGTGNRRTPDLHRGAGLPNPRPDPARGTRGGAWQVRADAAQLPPKSPTGAVQQTADERRVEPAPDGNRADGDGAAGTAIGADGKVRGRDGTNEVGRPAGVDSADDQHPQPRGRNDSGRPDLQLNLPSPEEQQNMLERAEGTAATPTPSVFSMPIPMEALDEELATLFECRPVYHLGDTVFIGIHEYEVLAFDDSTVRLYDASFPLLNKEMPRAEFDRKVAENPANEHLMAVVTEQPKQPIPQSEPTITPQWEQKKKPARVNYFDAFPNVAMADRHNFKITDDNLGHGGTKAKFRANMDAIHLLHELELDGKLATPEQQEILSRYVGWGSLSQAFDPNNGAWANEFLELQTSLSTEEYESARATTLNAHYTSPTVIKAIYKAVENMGFTTGNILDPGCGVGNFQGLLPDSMSDSKVYGIEIDPITGRITQQLYQRNSIAIQGYEKTALPDSFFDLAIGNVPFGGYGVNDKKYNKLGFHIHDYFFAKTLDKVRPGGVVAFVTSSWTMDKQNPAVRKYIAQRADLLGAIRLPNNAFLANAGTEVTTDILFLQKRDRVIDVEPDWVHLSTTEEGIPVNQYFADHPDMVLGTMSRESGVRMYGNENSASCVPFPDSDLADLLEEAIQNIHAEITDYERDEDEQEADDSIPADPSVRNFSFAVVDGKLYFRENSRMKPVELPATTVSRIKGMIAIRDCVRTLIEYQTEDYSDSDIKAEQSKLNRLYDGFTKKYGLISSRANVSAFGSDSSFPLLGALEMLDEDGNLLRKADMFTKRTIRPKIEITHVDTATEALAVSMGEMAKVDIDYMTGLTGMDEDTLTKELEGVIFKDPADGLRPIRRVWLTAGEYLSGNVREKLETARRIAETDTTFAINVKSLEAVQPTDLTAAEISVRLGATWLPVEVVQQFIFEVLETPSYLRWNIKTHYSPHTAEWRIEGKSSDRSNVRAYNTYGTSRANAYKIIEETLNLRDIRIFDYVEDDEGKKKAVLNKKETMLAQAKQEQIKAAFQEWIWSDPERRNMLTRLYNDKFNSTRPREYDGSHIKFVGMNPTIDLREHQVNAVAHIMYGGNTLLAHDVGAGKTFEMVAAAMEMKRLGLCHKSMVVVPNHIIEQFAAEWLQLYPSANILVSTKKDFEPKNRRKFCARIATGDYDAVIIGHSQFEKIPTSIEFQRQMLEDQLDDLLAGIAEAKQNKGDNFTVKQLEKSRKSLQLRLDKLNDQSRKDDLVTFGELGVDRLFVDEAHGYKNLFLYTKMRNVGGVAQTEAQKSSDMFMKCRYLDKQTDRRGVIFATGTPISNSMVELYSIQRYLQYDTLREQGLQHFDAWASTFGETVTAIELAPEGSGYRAKTRFAKFYNLPELMNMFREVADIQTAEMLHLPVPKANFHTVVVEPSEMQQEMVANLAERTERVRNRMVDSHVDNMLCITNDGRKLALDQRLMNPMLPDFEGSKAVTAVTRIFKHWENGRDERLAQLVFCDLSTPKNDGSFNVYDDIRQKLVARGVPTEEIAFIHDANTEQKKKDLFAKVRTGTVRVLMGSTAKCGTGMDVQDRLIALYDLDVPWRPSDMVQRLGRIVRQGNMNPEVEIYRYVTEKTFDAYSYQLIETKQRFVSQVMTGKSPVRSAEDVDEQALSYAEIKALATGNPMIIEKCDLEMQTAKLKLLKASHLSQRYNLEDRLLKHYPAQIRGLTEKIAGLECDIATVAANPKAQGDGFVGIVLKDTPYTDKKAAGTAILEACQAMTNPDPVPLGSYRGFTMDLSYDAFSKEYRATLKGALSHTVNLSNDIFGNITRLDNALEGFPAKLSSCQEQLETEKVQMENAKAEVERPFPQEAELAEKTARLAEVNIALNLDKRENELVDAEPDEGEADAPERKSKDRGDAR
jgi:N12 class adenine-specific DNA methylase